MFYRLRDTLIRFMAGRYGGDKLNNFLLGVYFLLWLVGLFFSGLPGRVLYIVSMLVLAWAFWRMLSRNIPGRQAENERFLRLWDKWNVSGWLRRQGDRLRDIRRFRYRRCPGCSAWLRLPIRRGRRTVTCNRCRTQFKAFFL